MSAISTSVFYRAVRQFAVSTPIWGEAIRYQTTPDERHDLTLVSQRVYGNRNEALAVMAAAGLDRFDDPLTEQTLILPTPEQLEEIKRSTGHSQHA